MTKRESRARIRGGKGEKGITNLLAEGELFFQREEIAREIAEGEGPREGFGIVLQLKGVPCRGPQEKVDRASRKASHRGEI